MDGAHLVPGLTHNRHIKRSGLRSQSLHTTYPLTLSREEHSILFSFHREAEELEELKGQNWELPLQDGEGLCTWGVPAETIKQWARVPGHWTSLMCDICSPEPLYQTYRAAVLSEELWGVSEDGGPSSANPGEAPPFARPPGPRNTLWQELPAVRASGLLDTLSPQERRMQEVDAPGVGRGGGGVGWGRSLGPGAWATWELGFPLRPCCSSSEPVRGGDIRGLVPALPAAADRHLCAEPGAPGHAHPPGSPHPLLQRAARPGSQ